MTKNKGNKFTLSSLDSKIEHINKQEKYIINEETGDFINYFPRFSKTKKDDMFKELLETYKYAKENKISYFENDFEILHYLHFLIFKYFTSLYSELKGKSVEVHIETFSKLYESGLLDEVLNNAFDDDEINKVIEQFYDITDKAPLIAKMEDNFKQELVSKVQSEVLRKKIIPEV